MNSKDDKPAAGGKGALPTGGEKAGPAAAKPATPPAPATAEPLREPTPAAPTAKAETAKAATPSKAETSKAEVPKPSEAAKPAPGKAETPKAPEAAKPETAKATPTAKAETAKAATPSKAETPKAEVPKPSEAAKPAPGKAETPKAPEAAKPEAAKTAPMPAPTAPSAKAEAGKAAPPKAEVTKPSEPVKGAEAAKPAAAKAPEAMTPPSVPPSPPAAAKPAPAKTVEAAKPTPPKLEPVPLSLLAPEGDVQALLAAEHRDPFAFLGMHVVQPGNRLIVRALMPQVSAVAVIDAASGDVVGVLDKVRGEGLFAGPVAHREGGAPGKPFPYRLKLTTEDGERIVDDAYRFPPLLTDADERLLAEGTHLRAYEKLGAHPMVVDGVAGTAFVVWAPNAGRVAVIGTFNGWDGRCHGMRRRHGCGAWEIFIPGVRAGELYKYEIKTASGVRLTDKTDPVAFAVEQAPGVAAVVGDLDRHRWGDQAWMARRASFNAREEAIAIYEVHLGSWRRKPEEGHRWLTYRELADELPAYAAELGFTHIELLPVSEFDFAPSLGYQPLVPYAPTSRWGAPEDFALLVDRCHQAGVGVILDWVPHGFSDNPHGLREFDGTFLYEAADPQRRHHPGSSALVYEYGRPQVVNYLLANACYWFDRFHVDALRVPELPKMLYLDYGRGHGEWTANRFGGHENLEAVDFIHRFNEEVYKQFPGIFTVAEDSSAWPRVSHPTFLGGLGFGFRWNAPWTRDTLRYMARNPVHRKYYHDELTYGPSTAFQENFILPLSHDEVAFGKGSLLRRMPGDRWQKFANLRAYYALMYTHPGKKLLFMGNEFAQEREWNSDISLDWHLLADPMHEGVRRLVRDLNLLYRQAPALHQLDCEASGFAWIDCNDSDQSVISFLRRARNGEGTCVIVSNFTPVIRNDYRIGVPEPGFYEERLNTDAEIYGGTNTGSAGGVHALSEGMHGRPYSLSLRLPPFATVILQHRGG